MVMDEHGIPIDYDLFPGNTSEFSTMIPMIERIRKDYNLTKLVVVADRGLNSNENLSELRKMGCDFVLAQKIRNCKQEQRDQILDDTGWEHVISEQDGVVLCRYKTLAMKKPLYETRINPETGRKSQSRKAGKRWMYVGSFLTRRHEPTKIWLILNAVWKRLKGLWIRRHH